MRIFQVCADYGIPPGGTRGSSVHLRSLAGALAERGHEVSAFTARALLDSETYPVRLFPLVSADSIVEAATALGRPDFIYERYSLARRPGENIRTVSDAGLTASRQLGCPLVLEVNSPLIQETCAHYGLRASQQLYDSELRLFRNADVIVTVSESLLRFVGELRGTDEGVFVIPNGCDPRLFAGVLPERAGNVLVFLGDPRPWHGAETLPAMVARLAGEGLDPRLLIIGGGPGADSVAEAAASVGVGGRVEVTGPLPQRAAIDRLVHSDIGVAPYPPNPDFYFSPIKVVEYMAAGLPVVATAQGELEQIIGDGGILVEPGDTGVFSAVLGGLLADPDGQRQIGSLGRERALTNFTWERAACELEQCVAWLGALR